MGVSSVSNEEINLALSVREGDYDRFLCIQLAPPAARPALYALSAFSIELAHVAEVVSDALLGHIRFAWWREALEEIADGKTPRNHPVVLALAALHPTHPQIFVHLQRMIEARAMDLDGGMTVSEEAWLAYLDGTAGALHSAWAIMLGAPVDDTVRNQARAYAMIGLLRALPYHVAQRVWRFPPTRLAEDATGAALEAAMQSIVADALGILHASCATARMPLPLLGLAKLTRMHASRMRAQRGKSYDFATGKFRAAFCVAAIKVIKKQSIVY